MTIHGMMQFRLEDNVGSLQVGNLADRKTLENDLFNVAVHRIHATTVLQTIMDGRAVH